MVVSVEYGIYLNYGGKFIRDPTLWYVGGSFREKLQGLHIDIDGMTDFVWYKNPAKKLDNGLVLIVSNDSILDMFELLMYHEYIDVYVEHESKIEKQVTKGGPSHGNNGSVNDVLMVCETVACNVNLHTSGVDLEWEDGFGCVSQEIQTPIVGQNTRNCAKGRTKEDVNSGDEYIDVPWLTNNEDEEWQATRTQYKDSVKLYGDDADIDGALFDPTEAFVDDGLSDSIDSNDEVSFVTTSDDSEAKEVRRRRSLHKVFDDSTVNLEFEV
ncbi:hypothetical protein SLE2022_315420 [Rubroshorea leprosula]